MHGFRVALPFLGNISSLHMNTRSFLLVGFFFFSSCQVIDHLPPYKPQIIFDGEINGVAMHLPGYLDFPNSCRISGDSVIMDMYSDDYAPSTSPLTTSAGTYLRIKVFPQPGDSFFVTSLGFTERNCQVHYVVHSSLGTCSYDITPEDTLTKSQTFSMHNIHFEVSQGSEISLDKITASSKSLTPYCPSSTNAITNGTITGSVE
jgi:hypothetical protein